MLTFAILYHSANIPLIDGCFGEMLIEDYLLRCFQATCYPSVRGLDEQSQQIHDLFCTESVLQERILPVLRRHSIHLELIGYYTHPRLYDLHILIDVRNGVTPLNLRSMKYDIEILLEEEFGLTDSNVEINDIKHFWDLEMLPISSDDAYAQAFRTVRDQIKEVVQEELKDMWQCMCFYKMAPNPRRISVHYEIVIYVNSFSRHDWYLFEERVRRIVNGHRMGFLGIHVLPIRCRKAHDDALLAAMTNSRSRIWPTLAV